MNTCNIKMASKFININELEGKNEDFVAGWLRENRFEKLVDVFKGTWFFYTKHFIMGFL
jgi:hypothetical protein